MKKTSKASKDHMVPGPTYQPIFWALEYLAFRALSVIVSSFCCHATPPILSQPQLNKRNYPTKIFFKRKGGNNIWVPKILLFHKKRHSLYLYQWILLVQNTQGYLTLGFVKTKYFIEKYKWTNYVLIYIK